MTFWEIRADYRKLSGASPIYLFCSENGIREREVKKRFLHRYSCLTNMEITQLTMEQMEKREGREWMTWL